MGPGGSLGCAKGTGTKWAAVLGGHSGRQAVGSRLGLKRGGGSYGVSLRSQVARLKPRLWSSWPLQATRVLSPSSSCAAPTEHLRADLVLGGQAKHLPATLWLPSFRGHMFGHRKCVRTGRGTEELCLVQTECGWSMGRATCEHIPAPLS